MDELLSGKIFIQITNETIKDDVGCQRIGPMHQAGSDSMLTCDAWFKIAGRFFGGADVRSFVCFFGRGWLLFKKWFSRTVDGTLCTRARASERARETVD